MPLINLRNAELTLMDVFSIIGSGIFALSVWYGLSAEVDINKSEISHLKHSVARVERQAGEASDRILAQQRELANEVKLIRTESAAERNKIMVKLDRIIEREINNGRLHRD